MNFEIDTGDVTESNVPAPKSSMIEGSIDLLSQPEWAERAHRQIIGAVQLCETTEELQEYWDGETLLLDAFYMALPEYWERIKEAHDEQRIFITSSTASAQADTVPAAPGNCLGLTF